jgi:hypothetical protein
MFEWLKLLFLRQVILSERRYHRSVSKSVTMQRPGRITGTPPHQHPALTCRPRVTDAVLQPVAPIPGDQLHSTELTKPTVETINGHAAACCSSGHAECGRVLAPPPPPTASSAKKTGKRCTDLLGEIKRYAHGSFTASGLRLAGTE